jgi:hypothetical protein
MKTPATEVEARATAEHADIVGARARVNTVFGSTSWRRMCLRAAPSRPLARLLRRMIKLFWWTVTFQLPARYRLWRQVRTRAVTEIDRLAEPSPVPVFASAAMLESAFGRIKTLERRVGTLESAAASALERIDTMERAAEALRSLVEMERDRLDWALGALEGMTAKIDAYHAYRETDAYRAAFATMEPLVSICVATMDRADLLLGRCIPSLLAQTYRNIQIVIVGDNCTDDTERRVAAVEDRRVQFLNLSERGPYPRPGTDRWYVAGSNAMNRALSLCEGQFVTHIDDDDAMVPGRIEILVSAAMQAKADFLWHPLWYQNFDGTWRRVGNGRLELSQVGTGSIFYHRYFARFPWDVRAYRLGEPGDWNRLRKIKMLRPRLHYVDEPLAYHHAEQHAPFAPREGERFLE